MSFIQEPDEKDFFTIVLGLVSGLATSYIVKVGLESRRPALQETAEDDPPEPDENLAREMPAPANNEQVSSLPEEAPPAKVMPVALVCQPSEKTVIEIKKGAETPSKRIPVVRKANYIAFKGFEFQIFTGKYRCTLDYFDTYYFNFLGDGVNEDGSQFFKFKAKERETEKAEIRFKLTGSKFSKLIYQVSIVESFIHFLPGNSPLEEEQQDGQ